MANPADMTDDELNKVIETGVVPEEPTSEPVETPEEPTAEAEPPEAPAEEAPQEEDKTHVPEEQPPSRREQFRIQTLLAKYGNPAERTPQPAPSQASALDYQTALDADPEVIQQLEADRQRTAQYQFNEGLRRAEAIEFKTNIRLDLPLVTEKLQKLDPRDAEALDKEYLYTVGFDPKTGFVQNPNIGYAEFIEARLDQAERLAKSMTAQTTQNIAKQAATTGLRPDGSSAKRLNLNQAPENMTMEELYASIGQTPPKK